MTLLPGSGPFIQPAVTVIAHLALAPEEDPNEGGQMAFLPASGESGEVLIDRAFNRLRVLVGGTTIMHVDANGIFSEIAFNHYVNGIQQALLGGGATAADETPLHLRLNDDTLHRVEVGADGSGGTGLAALVVPNQGV